MALGIDVTFGATTIQKKFQRIKKEIEAGQLASIKYFQSGSGKKEKLAQVPRIVVGMEKENLEKLAALWIQGKNKELGMHPVQRLILVEALRQLETFANYATERGRAELAKPYADAIALVQKTLANKSAIKLGELERDRVFQEILASLHSFKPRRAVAA